MGMLESTVTESHPSLLDDVQQFTQEYATLARYRGGLSYLLSGLAALIIYGIDRFSISPASASWLAVGTIGGWLIGQEVSHRYLDHRLGTMVAALSSTVERRSVRLLALGALIVMALWVFGLYVVEGAVAQPSSWPYLLLSLVMPLVAWQSLPRANDLLVASLLVTASALMSLDRTFALWVQLQLPCYAMLFIVAGLAEYRQLRALTVRLSVRHDAEE